MFDTLEDGLDEFGIHDGDQRAAVREAVNAILAGPVYQRAYQLEPGTSLAEAIDARQLAVWVPPSGTYLAVGGHRFFGPDHTDPYELVVQVFKTRIAVNSVLLYSPLELARGWDVHFETPAVPPFGASRGATSPGVCPTCQQVLPLTGVCDNCS